MLEKHVTKLNEAAVSLTTKKKAIVSRTSEAPLVHMAAGAANMVSEGLAVTHTFSECVENHAGMATIGTKANVGILEDELAHIAQAMECAQKAGSEQNSVSLIEMERNGERANVMVWKGGVNAMLGEGGADKLLLESLSKSFDTTYLDTRRKRVLNKHGRENNCYADEAAPPNVEEGRGTVHAFADSPMMAALRAALPIHFGPKAANLFAETNKYGDISKKTVGIGFHGACYSLTNCFLLPYSNLFFFCACR